MFVLLHTIRLKLARVERWFDKRFGWFFTNGMKGRRSPPGPAFKA